MQNPETPRPAADSGHHHTVAANPGVRLRAGVIAALVALLVFGIEQVIEHFVQARERADEQQSVLHQLSAVRAQLEGVVNANLFLVHGLTAVIAAQPDMNQAGFGRIARNLVNERHALRHIGAAPDMVISMLYPLEGNEAALGLDYRKLPEQREGALRARDSRQTVVAGPLTLEQGGTAIIAREPVFLPPTQPGGEERFWGLVSAVIDVDTLFDKAGLRAPDLELRVALRGTDGTGPAGPVFFGDASLFDSRPVTLEVTLPGGAWQLAAIPANGWGPSSTAIDLLRLMGLLSALVAGGLAYRLVRGAQQLAGQSARLHALLNTIPDLVWLKDSRGAYLDCNPRCEKLFGASKAEIKGKTDFDFVPAEQAELFRAKDQAAIAMGGPTSNEEWVTFASDGHRELLETIKTPVFDDKGNLFGVLGIARNITERKQAEEHIHRLNRLYGMLSGINEAIVRLRNPQSLFDEACRIAVEIGGFRMAWLGMVDAGQHVVRPLAHAGVSDHYLENLHISLDEGERSNGPTATALQAGQHIVCNDIAADPHMAPWRDAALALGYQSSTALPIRVGGQVRGAFNLYADSPGFFDQEELRLLDKVADDIGFALEFIEAAQTMEALNRRMVDLLESMSDGFVSLDRKWHYQYVNRRAGEMFGQAPDALLGKHIWTVFPEGVGQPFHQAYERVMNGGEMICLEEHYPPWNRWFENRIYPTQDGISIFFTDITERKKQEEELKHLHTTLSALVEGSTDAIFVKDREGRYLVANKALADLLHRPVATVIGADDYSLFTAEIAERFRADDRRIMTAGVTETYEEPVVTPVADQSHLTTKGPLMIDGEVRGVFGISRDVTLRKRAELALREQLNELTRWQKVVLGREERIQALKSEINELLAEQDRPIRYLSEAKLK